jgi:hypothetical protein
MVLHVSDLLEDLALAKAWRRRRLNQPRPSNLHCRGEDARCGPSVCYITALLLVGQRLHARQRRLLQWSDQRGLFSRRRYPRTSFQ